MPVTDTLDNISKIKLRTLLSTCDTDYKFQKDSIYYDVKVHPANHLKAFFKLQQLCERAKKSKKKYLFPYPKKPVTDKYHIWSQVVSLKEKAFKPQGPDKSLRFQGTLETDRIGVSVLKQNTSTNRRLAGSGRQQSVTKDEYKIENIQDLTQETLNRTIDNCVLIDPGRCDLMYCMHETSTVKEKKAFIFTKNNRTNLSKHFRSLRKRSQPFAIKAAGAALSETNSSSVSVDKFVQYIKTRASVKNTMYAYYGNETTKSDKVFLPDSELDFRVDKKEMNNKKLIASVLQKLQLLPFRKIKFSTKLYYDQNDLELVNNLKTKFGPNAVLILGDWFAPDVPHQESTRNKGLIKMLKKNVFVVYLINEFRISSLCPFCGASLQTFKIVPNPLPHKRTSMPTATCHELLR
ncbi:hypothetical protein EDC94DRAFT_640296 [Helicostylum pulchrum]|nr:hypothetical protein EDC94DRAFT_640296 [Helicostylum pulchrum]